MSVAGNIEVSRMMQVVQAAQAWVRDVTSLANDWTSQADDALINAIDQWEHPAAFAAHRYCWRDAIEEHRTLRTGQYLCNRVIEHSGACRYRPERELALQQ